MHKSNIKTTDAGKGYNNTKHTKGWSAISKAKKSKPIYSLSHAKNSSNQNNNNSHVQNFNKAKSWNKESPISEPSSVISLNIPKPIKNIETPQKVSNLTKTDKSHSDMKESDWQNSVKPLKYDTTQRTSSGSHIIYSGRTNPPQLLPNKSVQTNVHTEKSRTLEDVSKHYINNQHKISTPNNKFSNFRKPTKLTNISKNMGENAVSRPMYQKHENKLPVSSNTMNKSNNKSEQSPRSALKSYVFPIKSMSALDLTYSDFIKSKNSSFRRSSGESFERIPTSNEQTINNSLLPIPPIEHPSGHVLSRPKILIVRAPIDQTKNTRINHSVNDLRIDRYLKTATFSEYSNPVIHSNSTTVNDRSLNSSSNHSDEVQLSVISARAQTNMYTKANNTIVDHYTFADNLIAIPSKRANLKKNSENFLKRQSLQKSNLNDYNSTEYVKNDDNLLQVGKHQDTNMSSHNSGTYSSTALHESKTNSLPNYQSISITRPPVKTDIRNETISEAEECIVYCTKTDPSDAIITKENSQRYPNHPSYKETSLYNSPSWLPYDTMSECRTSYVNDINSDSEICEENKEQKIDNIIPTKLNRTYSIEQSCNDYNLVRKKYTSLPGLDTQHQRTDHNQADECSADVKREIKSILNGDEFGDFAYNSSEFHPDSYIAHRQNIRKGFDGNYRRYDPNEYSKIMGFKNGYLKQHSPNFNPSDSLIPSSNSSLSDVTSIRNDQSNKTNQVKQTKPRKYDGDLSVNSLSTRSVNNTKQINFPYQQSETQTIQLSTLAMPQFKWRNKTKFENELDNMLLNLLERLPASRQNSFGLITLLMSMRSQNVVLKKQNLASLETRLCEALQLDEFDDDGPKDKPLSENVQSSSAANGSSDQLTYTTGKVPDSASSINERILHLTPTDLEDGHESGIDADDSSIHLPNGDRAQEKSTIIDLLRRLSQWLAIRIAHKQHCLQIAEQHKIRNSIEEKLLRTRLCELNDELLNQPQSAIKSTIDATETYFGVIVSRFDRFHSNTVAVIQLLCQLARRLISLDARILRCTRQFSQKHMINKSSDKPDSIGSKAGLPVLHEEISNLSLSQLLEQKKHLLTQVKEAQELRAGIDKCRRYLLGNIPADLKCDTAYTVVNSMNNYCAPLNSGTMTTIQEQLDHITTFFSNMRSNSVPLAQVPTILSSSMSSLPLVNLQCDHQGHLTATELAEKSARDSIELLLSNAPKQNETDNLRQRVHIHLIDFLYWLITYEIFETELKVDRELWDNIQNDLRLDMSY